VTSLSRKLFLTGIGTALAGHMFPPASVRASGPVLRLGGTGAGLGLQQHLSRAFAAKQSDLSYDVLPSLGSAGGIRALAAGALDIAFSGRPLTAEEQKLNLVATPLLRTPVALLSSHPGVSSLSVAQLADIYANRQQAWPDGTSVRIILRPKSEASFISLVEAYPEIGAAIDSARARTEIPVATTDQDNFTLAQQVSGSLAVALLVQFMTEPTRLRALALDGVVASPANLQAGTYKCFCDLYLVVRRDAAPVEADFARFITGGEGRDMIASLGGWPLTA
jgi:phosphate transport system substrate-binding protein